MKPYRLTLKAKKDLIGIRRYTVKLWGVTQSKKYLAELWLTFEMLGESPAAGRSCPEVGYYALRFPHGRHTTYYSLIEQHVVIFAVLHQSMDPVKNLKHRSLNE